jgi:O-succinylbenzoic acid--CoA ligase
VALVRPQAEGDGQTLVQALSVLVRPWPAAERPRRWLLCPELDTGSAGKWERARWQAWVDRRLPLPTPPGSQG